MRVKHEEQFPSWWKSNPVLQSEAIRQISSQILETTSFDVYHAQKNQWYIFIHAYPTQPKLDPRQSFKHSQTKYHHDASTPGWWGFYRFLVDVVPDVTIYRLVHAPSVVLSSLAPHNTIFLTFFSLWVLDANQAAPTALCGGWGPFGVSGFKQMHIFFAHTRCPFKILNFLLVWPAQWIPKFYVYRITTTFLIVWIYTLFYAFFDGIFFG